MLPGDSRKGFCRTYEIRHFAAPERRNARRLSAPRGHADQDRKIGTR